ncbi:MAG: LacI family DNA-binding transcriptional regulator [Bacillota bacterium]|nr:LacI family DNA-binding transcriptional regulator [Bacillota bacterium]
MSDLPLETDTLQTGAVKSGALHADAMASGVMANSRRSVRTVTIKDVARAAGVSASTVSRALSGKIPVDAQTLQRVRRETKRLGYRPNFLARSLKEGSSKTIGLIVPDITNPVFPAVALGAETEAVRHGFQVYLAHSHEDAEKEAMLANLLVQNGAAGILVATACRGSASPADWDMEQLPVCQLVRRQTNKHPCVCVDQFMVGRLAAERLLVIGCKRPAILVGDQSLSLHRDRLNGFIATLAGAGILPDQIQVIDSSAPDEDGCSVTKKLLAAGGPPIDSIFAASDMQALGVMRTLYLEQVPVPVQIAVIGVDNMGISSVCTPAITCIRQPLQEIGRLACNRLIEAILSDKQMAGQAKSKDLLFEPVLLPSELFIGETA